MPNKVSTSSSPITPRLFRFVSAKPEVDAQRRRDGLRGALELYHLTPTELAKRGGLPSANAIYNFLNGHSEALSLETLERILTALPSLSFDQLVGWAPYHEVGNLVVEQPSVTTPEQPTGFKPQTDVVIHGATSVNGRITLKGIAEVPAAWSRLAEPFRLKIALALEA